MDENVNKRLVVEYSCIFRKRGVCKSDYAPPGLICNDPRNPPKDCPYRGIFLRHDIIDKGVQIIDSMEMERKVVEHLKKLKKKGVKFVYAHEVAKDLNMPIELVEEILDDLVEQGRIKEVFDIKEVDAK